MLRLELSDGEKTVIAMEVSIIPILNTKLNPGCKFMLSGPIRCINKVLLLEKNNITLLGGEVAEFLIDNAYENVLRKIIGLPINPEPIKDYKGLYFILILLINFKLIFPFCREYCPTRLT